MVGFKFSPDFTWQERGAIVRQVSRGKSYSEVARYWSSKKHKSIAWSTIRSICNRVGVQSVHPNNWDHGQGRVIHQEKPGLLSRIFDSLFR